MKTSLQVYKDTPPEFVAVREFMVQRLVEMMRLFGINAVHTEWSQVGLSGVMSVDFTPAEAEPPGHLKTLRPKMVRWVAEGMQSIGIFSIETSPTPDEVTELNNSWKLAMTVVDPVTADYGRKLPPDVDPSND
jgi:hypothetical protein